MATCTLMVIFSLWTFKVPKVSFEPFSLFYFIFASFKSVSHDRLSATLGIMLQSHSTVNQEISVCSDVIRISQAPFIGCASHLAGLLRRKCWIWIGNTFPARSRVISRGSRHKQNAVTRCSMKKQTSLGVFYGSARTGGEILSFSQQ